MFEVQDEGSQLLTAFNWSRDEYEGFRHVGKRTKTILMSNLLQSKGFITAFDNIKARLSVLKEE